MRALNSREARLLAWLRDHPKATPEEIAAAPCYTERRKDQLRDEGAIRVDGVSGMNITYSITDAGLAALEAFERNGRAERRANIALFVSILAIAISAAALFLQWRGS